MKYVTTFFATLILSVWASAGHASLIGASVNQTYYFPDQGTTFCDNGNAVVGAGIEYPGGCSGFGPVVTDITANQILVDTGGSSWSSGDFNGFLLSILAGPAITSAVYAGGSMAVTSLEIDGGNLWVNFAGQTGGRAVINIGTGAVPAPMTAALVLLGLIGLGRRQLRGATA